MTKDQLDSLPPFEESNWKLIGEMNDLFLPTMHALDLLQADKYPTQGLILLVFISLDLEIDNLLARKKEIIRDDIDDLALKIAADLKEELAQVWDYKLPEETLLATLLDPRFKSLTGVPEKEAKDAWKSLEKEFEKHKKIVEVVAKQAEPSELLPEIEILSESESTDESEVEVNPASESSSSSEEQLVVPTQPTLLLKRKSESFSFFARLREKGTEPTTDLSEMERWKALKEIDISCDPLVWWKLNQIFYPVLSSLAKMYLAVPASQATTERSFSAAGNICTAKRNSLSPQHVEKLTIFHQNIDDYRFDEIDDDPLANPSSSLFELDRDDNLRRAIESIPNETHNAPLNDAPSNSNSSASISVAQPRRAKIAIDEVEICAELEDAMLKAALIASKQEYESTNKDREEHERRLAERLVECGLTYRSKAPRDGNCLFVSVADQLAAIDLHVTAKKLRTEAVGWLRDHGDFVLNNGETIKKFVGPKPADWRNYLANLGKEGVWGDHLTIIALASIYRLRVKIISSSDGPRYITTVVPVDDMVDKTILLAHLAEFHYDSLQ